MISPVKRPNILSCPITAFSFIFHMPAMAFVCWNKLHADQVRVSMCHSKTSCWQIFTTHYNHGAFLWYQGLGYSKVADEGDEFDEEEEEEDEWPSTPRKARWKTGCEQKSCFGARSWMVYEQFGQEHLMFDSFWPVQLVFRRNFMVEPLRHAQVVVLRAGLVPSMTHDSFVKLLEGVPGVESAVCEWAAKARSVKRILSKNLSGKDWEIREREREFSIFIFFPILVVAKL